MRADGALLGLHGTGAALALAAALVWPRPGEAAVMVPLGGGNVSRVLDWAEQADAPLLAIDTTRGRVIARISDNRSLLDALAAGIIPLAARAPGCRPTTAR